MTGSSPSPPRAGGAEGRILLDLLVGEGRKDRLVHAHHDPPRPARTGDWPSWVAQPLREAWGRSGIDRPFLHQLGMAELARAGHHVVIATGTASGKSVAYWMPSLTALLEDASERSTVLHLSPTKALAADQFRTLRALGLEGLRAAVYDGDTEQDERLWVRQHARYVMTNPDMLHHALLPGHERFGRFLGGLRFVVIDEAHAYRGLFGAHVALVLRRLQRICATHGSAPVVLLASATMADPARSAERLIGAPVRAVTEDTSPHPGRVFALWRPPLIVRTADEGRDDGALDDEDAVADADGDASIDDVGPRRSAVAESADLVAALVGEGARTLAFLRSRRAVEAGAEQARERLSARDPDRAGRIAAYRGGFLPEERRSLEERLRTGALLGVCTTNALELGIDVSGLDAVVISGWPGTRASVMQQAGRAGRADREALAVLVGRDDPLDRYVLEHPETLFGRPLEEVVFDPSNPYVLAPHLCAAASESPLALDGPAGPDLFGPQARPLLDVLVARGLLRRRPAGWFWTARERAQDLADLRGGGGAPLRIVEEGTGRLLGTVDAASAHRLVHPGAVYVHQGVEHLVVVLDEDDGAAIVRRAVVDHSTHARSVTDVAVLEVRRTHEWGSDASVHLGMVEVTTQVVGFVRRRKASGERLGEEPLDLPARTLRTASTWWTVDDQALLEAGLDRGRWAGAAHAAEHAAIGLLPLLATCDRWDLGGLSTVLHRDTGRLTVFVHDAAAGGAGFAERGFAKASRWWRMTREAIAACPCRAGCPACVQSPKCGNGNDPLDKDGAVVLLDVLLRGCAEDAAENGGSSTSEGGGPAPIPTG